MKYDVTPFSLQTWGRDFNTAEVLERGLNDIFDKTGRRVVAIVPDPNNFAHVLVVTEDDQEVQMQAENKRLTDILKKITRHGMAGAATWHDLNAYLLRVEAEIKRLGGTLPE